LGFGAQGIRENRRRTMKNLGYQSGLEARKNFEETMQKLFRAPKTALAKPPKPKKAESEK